MYFCADTGFTAWLMGWQEGTGLASDFDHRSVARSQTTMPSFMFFLIFYDKEKYRYRKYTCQYLFALLARPVKHHQIYALRAESRPSWWDTETLTSVLSLTSITLLRSVLGLVFLLLFYHSPSVNMDQKAFLLNIHLCLKITQTHS